MIFLKQRYFDVKSVYTLGLIAVLSEHESASETFDFTLLYSAQAKSSFEFYPSHSTGKSNIRWKKVSDVVNRSERFTVARENPPFGHPSKFTAYIKGRATGIGPKQGSESMCCYSIPPNL